MTNDLTATIQTYLTSAPSSDFNGLAVHMVDHWTGSDNLLWRVDAGGTDAVLKLFLDAGQARSRRQFDGHQIFAQSDLAPEPLWVDRYPEGLARQVMVYRWAEGEPFQPGRRGHWLSSARAIGQLHATEVDAVRRFSPNPINLAYLWRLLETTAAQVEAWLHNLHSPLLRFVSQLNGAAAALVEEALPAWQGALPAPVHGDLKAENLIVRTEHTILLDWEQFGLGDPAQDVAFFLHRQRNEVEPYLIDEWLATYTEIVNQTEVLPRIAAYRQILPFRDLLYLLDGMRDLTISSPELSEHRDALPFLAATIQASAESTVRALNIGDAQPADKEIKAAVDALFRTVEADMPATDRRPKGE